MYTSQLDGAYIPTDNGLDITWVNGAIGNVSGCHTLCSRSYQPFTEHIVEFWQVSECFTNCGVSDTHPIISQAQEILNALLNISILHSVTNRAKHHNVKRYRSQSRFKEATRAYMRQEEIRREFILTTWELKRVT